MKISDTDENKEDLVADNAPVSVNNDETYAEIDSNENENSVTSCYSSSTPHENDFDPSSSKGSASNDREVEDDEDDDDDVVDEILKYKSNVLRKK